jgi:cytochrome P450
LRELENFPYLNAVIKEALRLSSGVTSGLPRVVPPSGATIAGANVPAGVCFFHAKIPFCWLISFTGGCFVR